MRNTAKIISAMLLVIAVFSVLSCGAPAAPPQDVARLTKALGDAQSQVATLQAQLVQAGAMQAQYAQLTQEYNSLKVKNEQAQAQYDNLSKQLDAAKSDYQKLQAQFNDLTKSFDTAQGDYAKLKAQYDTLNKEYTNLTEGTALVNERDVEQALFTLVNQARRNAGLSDSALGENLYGWAMTNSRNMATNRQLEYSDYSSWNEALWTTGYISAERMAQAVFTIWQNSRQYERNFLNPSATYCAVGVYKPADIYYITYIASPFR